MSLAESQICKPLIKPATKLDRDVLVLLILKAFSIFFMICFDLLYVKLSTYGHTKPKKPLSTLLFIILFASTIISLSSGSFAKALFCSMNIREKICETQVNYRHEGAFHTIEDPIYVSAPCELFPIGYGDSRDFDILDINETVSPCSLELRSRFFIENFEMRASVNPNDFVLLDGEPLDLASHMDFHSWSKQGLAL